MGKTIQDYLVDSKLAGILVIQINVPRTFLLKSRIDEKTPHVTGKTVTIDSLIG